MHLENLNLPAVLVAALIGFVVGGLWYGPLFGAAWMRSIGLDPAMARNAPRPGMKRIFGFSFILQWVMALNLALFMQGTIGAENGAFYGLHVGLFLIAAALTINPLFEGRPRSYIAINAGYWVVTLTAMGLVLGVWR